MPTTPPLITAAQAGDREAVAGLYLQHHRAVRSYLARRCPADLADDLAQDVWVRALRALPSYQHTGAPFDAWLLTIARNLLLDHQKRAATQREVLADDPGRHQHGAAPGPEDQVLAELDAAPVRTAVGQLPAVHRQALVLTHWAGLSTAEISHRIGRSPAAIRTIKCRASAALRRQLTAA
ncbi:RNA polymerase sigma-70 factor (ECF subfamily) [Kitasatospora sp. GP30]|uniref:RNA polymerase sigma factor n=1 Tax=Kitasatospora sp. GP30 TaxID=3035084 RepID=UPI000C711222|nr:RNA polymerase sigma factor [Kitasatospora sp. GP30]MDH6141124.1 RNA polymerase sigma-70 factor (ECF subfamily) [Kitasatospora sp. GP30]